MSATTHTQYTDEEILESLRQAADENGAVPIETYNEKSDGPASSVIIDRFGSWVNAKREAGLNGDDRVTNGRPRKYSTPEMIEMLRECKRRHGTVSQAVFDGDDEFCSSGAIVKRFGTWSQAKTEAGVEHMEDSDE